MALFSNIIAPMIAGLFFLLYFAYFIIANPSKSASYRYFIIFLIGISVFSLGRPLQLILGPHPLPLVIVNLRVFILCSVIAPVIILASDLVPGRRRRRFELLVLSVGVLLGLTYVVFNSLGTRSSAVLFHFAGIAARDNLTPSMLPPFYAREVTIGVQLVTGLLLLVFPSIKLARLLFGRPGEGGFRNKVALLNGGVLIFALAFIVGSYTRQWGIYYAASIVSAVIIGCGVLADVRAVYRDYEKLLPFIKEDIVDNVAIGEFSKAKLAEMLGCLGKGRLDTIAVLRIAEARSALLEGRDLMEESLRIAGRLLAKDFSDECHLILPLAGGRVGIALRLAPPPEGGKREALWDLLEELRSEIGRSLGCAVSIGVGRSYERLEDLRTSYREALGAQEYAESLGGRAIVHADDIRELDPRASRYPLREKEKLLSLIKLGDVENSGKAFAEYLARFKDFIAEHPEALKVRLYELVGSLIDAAILGGGDEQRLNRLVEGYFEDIKHVKDAEVAERWLAKAVSETASAVARVYERRSKALVRDATRYVEAHFSSPLSYRDVAKEVFVSPSYFLCLFKRETGLTFVDYLTGFRVDQAKRLLASSSKSVTEIAYDVGFNNSNYFSSIFRKLVGTTAKEYRLRCRARAGAEGGFDKIL